MEITRSFLVLLCIVTLASFSWAVDYCGFKCPEDSKHTMCVYEDAPAKACTDYYNNKLTENEKKELLDTHNKLRQKVAAGKEKRGKPGPQPPATNMQIMKWDDELATIAQRWADQCEFGHDKCRNVERYPVGQNVGAKSITAENTFPIRSYVESWYDEVELFDSRQVSNVTKFNDVGHYTQLVWATSNRLGCGVMRYIQKPDWNTTYVVCNYGPTGNWYGSAMYKIPKKSEKERSRDKSEGDGEVEGEGSMESEGDGKVESGEEIEVKSEVEGKSESGEEEKTEDTKKGEVKSEERVEANGDDGEKVPSEEKGNQQPSE